MWPQAALRDSETGTQDLGTLGGDFSVGNGINEPGRVTGWSTTADGFGGAFLWDPVAGMLNLNDLIAPGSGWILGQGLAINDVGQITGSGTIGGETHAFLLTPGTLAAVPEPGTLALVGTGAIGLGLLRRRRCRDGT